jgi:hypothetical protein
MSVKRLVSGSDDVLTQDTDFSRDVSGRYGDGLQDRWKPSIQQD